MLNYEWKVIRATDYLEYERSGERNIMQNPYEANRKAINILMLAELAEGKRAVYRPTDKWSHFIVAR